MSETCDHSCIPNVGGFTCECDENFELVGNGTCKRTLISIFTLKSFKKLIDSFIINPVRTLIVLWIYKKNQMKLIVCYMILYMNLNFE